MKLLPLIVFLLISPTAAAVNCVPDSIVVGTQKSVNDFQANHGPGCDTVVGTLFIGDPVFITNYISNLDGLAGITTVGGSLYIRNNATLVDMDGLSGILSIGGLLELRNNWTLPTLGPLSGVTTVGGGIELFANRAITDLNGLSQINTFNGNLIVQDNISLLDLDALHPYEGVSGSLRITGNTELRNLYGLSNVSSVAGDLLVEGNDVLADLSGLSNVALLTGSLSVQFNDSLANLDALSGITSVGGSLQVTYNPALLNLDGLNHVTGTGGSLLVGQNGLILDVDGLSSVTHVGGALEIFGNQVLNNLNGLSAVIAVGTSVTIANSSLSFCAGVVPLFDDIDDAEPGPGPGLANIPDIGNNYKLQNGAGCNDRTEILETESQAVFKVYKDFKDNASESVAVSISCDTGTAITANPQFPSELNHAEFIVDGFTQGKLNCVITESEQDGYWSMYNNGKSYSREGCYHQNAVGAAYSCVITNVPLDTLFFSEFESLRP